MRWGWGQGTRCCCASARSGSRRRPSALGPRAAMAGSLSWRWRRATGRVPRQGSWPGPRRGARPWRGAVARTASGGRRLLAAATRACFGRPSLESWNSPVGGDAALHPLARPFLLATTPLGLAPGLTVWIGQQGCSAARLPLALACRTAASQLSACTVHAVAREHSPFMLAATAGWMREEYGLGKGPLTVFYLGGQTIVVRCTWDDSRGSFRLQVGRGERVQCWCCGTSPQALGFCALWAAWNGLL